MKPASFEYLEPTSIEEATSLLAEHGDEAKVLAGGQSLIPLMALRMARPAVVIDINRIGGMDGIAANGSLEVGALCRHRAVERSDVARRANPMLPAALRLVGHAAIRSRGTIGGSIAHADPAAELPTVLTALGGSVQVRSTRGEREIVAGELFQGFLTTSLEPDELITGVRFPTLGRRAGWGIHEFSRRSGDFALVGAAVVVEMGEGGTVESARIALSGVAGQPQRVEGAESVLSGRAADPGLLDEAAAVAAEEVDPSGDIHGSAAYRRHLVRVLVRRSLQDAVAGSEEPG